MCLLPSPLAYRALRRRILNPYALTVEKAVGNVEGLERMSMVVLKDLAPYLSTPLRALRLVLRRSGCGALLCQEYEHARFDVSVLLGKLLRLPVFATFQGGDEPMTRLERPVRALTVRACSGLVIAAGTEIERVRARYHVPEEKIAQIFNPVDTSLWHRVDRDEARVRVGLTPTCEVVAWHGRVELGTKGLDVLLRAWDQIRRERPDREIRLLLVGTGNDAARLRSRLAEAGDDGVIWVDRFLHDRTEIRRYLSAADVYAFPSRHEGFPVAPIEAMACSLPIVAADAQGIPDILQHGEMSGGIVVPRGDAAALALALGRLLDDRAFRQELGKRARKRAESAFSLHAVGAHLRDFLLAGSLRTREA